MFQYLPWKNRHHISPKKSLILFIVAFSLSPPPRHQQRHYEHAEQEGEGEGDVEGERVEGHCFAVCIFTTESHAPENVAHVSGFLKNGCRRSKSFFMALE